MAQLASLYISDLGINEDDEHFADGVACVQAYWAFSLEICRKDREILRKIIVHGHYKHTVSSKKNPSSHRLYKNRLGISIGGWIALRTLYKTLPHEYIERMTAKGITIPTRDCTELYFELMPHVTMPTAFNMNTVRARRYAADFPKLRQIPTTFRRLGATTGSATATPENIFLNAPSRVPNYEEAFGHHDNGVTADNHGFGTAQTAHLEMDPVAAARREGRAEGRAEAMAVFIPCMNAMTASVTAPWAELFRLRQLLDSRWS